MHPLRHINIEKYEYDDNDAVKIFSIYIIYAWLIYILSKYLRVTSKSFGRQM